MVRSCSHASLEERLGLAGALTSSVKLVGWVAAVTWSASYQLLLHQSSMTAMTGAEKLSPKIGDFRPNLDECVIAGVRG